VRRKEQEGKTRLGHSRKRCAQKNLLKGIGVPLTDLPINQKSIKERKVNPGDQVGGGSYKSERHSPSRRGGDLAPKETRTLNKKTKKITVNCYSSGEKGAGGKEGDQESR